jgi:hypothetical protein
MSRSRIAALCLVALVATTAATTRLRETQASWNDAAIFAATASTGTWPGDGDVSDGGISEGNENTAIDDIVWNPTNPNQFCTTITVTGTSAIPEHWQLTVDLTRAPFNGVAWNQVNVQRGNGAAGPNNTLIVTGTTSPGNPFNPNWNNSPITNTQQAFPQLCVYSTSPSPGDPSWYTVSVTQGTGSQWSARRACLTVTATTTVTDLALNPFYYSWQTDLNLAPAIARIRSLGGTPDAVEWSPWPSGGYNFNTTPTIYNPVQPSYAITSGTTTALRGQGSGDESATLTACVRDY